MAQLAHLHRVVQLAEKHQLLLVENDIYADLDPEPRPSLASLDQLQRVVYISSFSKTISPNLRVGYVAAHPDMLEDLAQLKMISGLTSSEFAERLASWRAGRRPLAQASARTARAAGAGAPGRRASARGPGFELFCEPKGRHVPVGPASGAAELDRAGLSGGREQHTLGPGHLFSTDLAPSPWLRFNVAFSQAPELWNSCAVSSAEWPGGGVAQTAQLDPCSGTTACQRSSRSMRWRSASGRLGSP